MALPVKLTVDYAFKRVFGENKEAFLGFVNAIFVAKKEPLVKEVVFLNAGPSSMETALGKGKAIMLFAKRFVSIS